MGESDGRQALPEMGPRGRDFVFWIAARPAMLLCDFCYQAAQVLAEDIRCAVCGQPAGDPDRDAVVVARAAAWLGAHFYLCSSCAEQDLHHIQHLG